MEKIKIPKEKIIVIYHGNCPDGFGGAWAAWKKFGSKAAYIGARDRLVLPFSIKNKIVYVIDYTYQPELMARLIKNNIKVVAIDHHISQAAATTMVKDHVYDLKHSAAPLAWNYFHPGKKMPAILGYVEDRDIWKWKLPNSREILMVLDLYPFDFKVWSQFAKELDNPKMRKARAKEGELLFGHYQSLYKKLLSGVELVRFEGKKIRALNCPFYFVDDLSRELIDNKHPMAILWSESNGRIRVSMRSKKSIDVSKIAKKYGGGGHAQASGFSFLVGQPTPWKIIAK